jgi:hypothetical protein
MDPKCCSEDSQALTAKDILDGLEVVPPIEHHKQVVQAEKEVAHLEDYFTIPVERQHVELSHALKTASPLHRTVCGMQTKLLFIEDFVEAQGFWWSTETGAYNRFAMDVSERDSNREFSAATCSQ